jgi:hypothetical protein
MEWARLDNPKLLVAILLAIAAVCGLAVTANVLTDDALTPVALSVVPAMALNLLFWFFRFILVGKITRPSPLLSSPTWFFAGVLRLVIFASIVFLTLGFGATLAFGQRVLASLLLHSSVLVLLVLPIVSGLIGTFANLSLMLNGQNSSHGG